LLGTAVLEPSQFFESGFEGELLLQVPTRLDEDPVFVKLKKLLRAAGYKYGGVHLAKLHRHCDRDSDGKLCFNEFVTSVRKDAKLSSEVISDTSLQRIFDEIDADGDGGVDFEEFSSWMNSTRKAAGQEAAAQSPVSPEAEEPAPSPFSPEPDEQPPAPETPAPFDEKDEDATDKPKTFLVKGDGAKGDGKAKMLDENSKDENADNMGDVTKGKDLQSDDKITGVDDKLKGKCMTEEQVSAFTLNSPFPASPRSPGEPIPEPSPFVEKTMFDDYPASPSETNLKSEIVAAPQVAGHLLIKIEILPPLKQGKRAFLEKSVNRLYKKHFEVRDKIETQKDTWTRRVDEQAYPNLMPSSIPMTPQGELLEYYHRLYLDAHRRTVDRRIKLKNELRQLKLMQDEESIHQKLLKMRKWEEQDIQAVFERVYQPAPRKMQLHKPKVEESASISADSDSEVEDAIVEHIPLPPRRMGIFFKREEMLEEEVQPTQEEEIPMRSSRKAQPRQSIQGGRGVAPRQSLQGRGTAPQQNLQGDHRNGPQVSKKEVANHVHRQSLQPRQSVQAPGHSTGNDGAVARKVRKSVQDQPSSARKDKSHLSGATPLDVPNHYAEQLLPPWSGSRPRKSVGTSSETVKAPKGILARNSLVAQSLNPNAFRVYDGDSQDLTSGVDSRPTTIVNPARRHPGDSPGPYSRSQDIAEFQTEAPSSGGHSGSGRKEDQRTLRASQSEKVRKYGGAATGSPKTARANLHESGSASMPISPQTKRMIYGGTSSGSPASARRSVQNV
jgi:hypothetical protein